MATGNPVLSSRGLGLERPAPRWVYRPVDDELAGRLRRELDLSPLMARILVSRGFHDSAQIEDYLNPALAKTHDPFLLKDMSPAVERIMAALEKGETICVYGDYDVDGITSTALLQCVFEFLGAEIETYIPHRMSEGYGLGAEAVRKLASRGVKLLITVDNGTTATEEVALANSLGVDVIVTDHHQVDATLPPALALINPNQPDCAYPFKDLCGVGVAFKLAHALLKKAAKDPEAAKEFLKNLLDFVALGTVSDVVALRDENRCFVRHGLARLRASPRMGLLAMMVGAGLDPDDIEAGKLGFTLAPRINAAGRTEHADYALELLLATEETRAKELAGLLERFNDDRRKIEREITAEAFEMIDPERDGPVIVLAREDWHQGVVGIVAARVMERYHRPAIVLSIDGDLAKGSARSIRGFDIRAALEHCRDHLGQFGGHPMAAGLQLKAGSVGDLRRALCEHADRVIKAEDLLPRINIDTTAEAKDLTAQNIEALEAFKPFGAANPRPVLAIEDLRLVEEPKILRDAHLKLRLSGPDGISISAIGFSMAHRAEDLSRPHGRLKLAAVPFINRWRGLNRVELELKDFTLAD